MLIVGSALLTDKMSSTADRKNDKPDINKITATHTFENGMKGRQRSGYMNNVRVATTRVTRRMIPVIHVTRARDIRRNERRIYQNIRRESRTKMG
jgi:hypothetical protein